MVQEAVLWVLQLCLAVNELEMMFPWEKSGLSQMCYCKITQEWRKTKGKHHTEKIYWGTGNSAETLDQRRTFSVKNQIILFLSKSNGPIWGTDRQDKASQPEWFSLSLKCVYLCESQINTAAEHRVMWPQWIEWACMCFCKRNEQTNTGEAQNCQISKWE